MAKRFTFHFHENKSSIKLLHEGSVGKFLPMNVYGFKIDDEEEKRKLNQAIKLWELATYRRIYVTWHSNVLDILEFKAKLKFAVQWWKNKEYAAGFGKFAAYRLWRIRRREDSHHKAVNELSIEVVREEVFHI